MKNQPSFWEGKCNKTYMCRCSCRGSNVQSLKPLIIWLCNLNSLCRVYAMDMDDKIKGVHLRGTKYTVSQDGLCPRCGNSNRLYVILDKYVFVNETLPSSDVNALFKRNKNVWVHDVLALQCPCYQFLIHYKYVLWGIMCLFWYRCILFETFHIFLLRLFPMGDMPEILHTLIAKGRAILWSSQEKEGYRVRYHEWK